MGRAINESERRFDGSGIGKVRWMISGSSSAEFP